MNAFDIMAEAKMRQWEQDVRDGKATRSTGNPAPALRMSESLEKVLFNQIRRTVIEAYMAAGETRKAMLNECADMQVQLASRLEKSGYNLMSRMLADEIQAVHARARAADNDAAALNALLKELG